MTRGTAEACTSVAGLMAAMLVVSGCYVGMSGNDPAADGPEATDGQPDTGTNGGDDGSGSGEDDGGDGPGALGCDPTLPPSEAPMRRLTKRQYENSLHDLTAWIVGEAEADDILTALAVKLSVVPDDDSSDFRRLDQSLSQAHIDGYYSVGRGLGARLTETTARLTSLAGACATDDDTSNDAQCVQDFVARFGRRAFRRPLSDEEVALYAADATGSTADVSPESFAERTSVLVMVPDFVYLIEDDNEEVADGLFELSAYEVASRLSFHFWQSAPDDALLQAAHDGTLDNDEGYETQLARIFENPRTQRTLDQFASEWLRLDELPALDTLAGTPAYDAFVGEDAPTSQLREAMIAEVQAVLRHVVFEQDGSLADLLQSNLALVTGEELAAIYGVELWVPGTAPDTMPTGERGGLLTRAAFVASGSPVTHPVIKGKRIRTRILCDTIPPPPADIPPPPQLDPFSTIRDQPERLTEREGTACLACHAMLNPLGYVTENYDGLGRLRTHEQVYDLATGERLGELPVNTETTPRVLADDDRVASSAAELTEYIVDSGRAEVCLSRQYFRFAYGRMETSADACAIGSLQQQLQDAGSLREMLLDVAFQPEFRLRYRTTEE